MLENIIVNGVTLCSCARSMASCRSMYMCVARAGDREG